MSFREKLKEELKSVALVTLYFAVWLGVLVLLKKLVLAEYRIEFHGMTLALAGALILAKVVLIMDHVPIGAWVRGHVAIVEVPVRTVLYVLGVAVVLVVEKAFDARHEYGGFVASLVQVFQHKDINHLWANVATISFALLWFNVLSVVHRHLGGKGLTRLFLSPR